MIKKPGMKFYVWTDHSKKTIITDKELDFYCVNYLFNTNINYALDEEKIDELKEKIQSVDFYIIDDNNSCRELPYRYYDKLDDGIVIDYKVDDYNNIQVCLELNSNNNVRYWKNLDSIDNNKNTDSCLHSNKYLNVISANIKFWYCKDCKKEING